MHPSDDTLDGFIADWESHFNEPIERAEAKERLDALVSVYQRIAQMMQDERLDKGHGDDV